MSNFSFILETSNGHFQKRCDVFAPAKFSKGTEQEILTSLFLRCAVSYTLLQKKFQSLILMPIDHWPCPGASRNYDHFHVENIQSRVQVCQCETTQKKLFFQGISLDLSNLPHVDGISVPLDDGYFKNYHYMSHSVNTWDAEYICNYHTLPATVSDQYQLGGYICNQVGIYATIILCQLLYQLGGYICNYHIT